MADLSDPASTRKAFLDTTVPSDRLLSSKATRARVNERLEAFSTRATCKFVQLEFLLGPWGHLAKRQAEAQAGVSEDELHRKTGEYERGPANRWQKRVGTVWHNAFDRFLERPDATPRSFRAFMRVFVRRAWAEAFAGVETVLDGTGCLGKVGEPVWNKQTNRGESPVSCQDLDRRAEDVAAFMRREHAQFGRIADALDAPGALRDEAEIQRRVAAIRKILSGGSKVKGGDIRHVGDALVAVECPPDHVLLTSNTPHFAPIAAAIGKVIEKVPNRQEH